MKTRIWIGLLAAAMLLIGLPAAAQVSPTSDCFTIYKNGAFQSAVCATEAQEEAAEIPVFFVSGEGFANTGMADSPTVLLDSDGSISDIFGVFLADTGQCHSQGCLFFLSDAEVRVFLDSVSGPIFLPEGDGHFDATPYLDPGKQRIGFTATFISDDGSVSQIPEPATLALLGVGVLAIGFVRRKSLPTTP